MTTAELAFWLSAATIGYVFVGYPLVLAVASRLVSKRPLAAAGALPSVSLIVSAYNEEEIIGQKIDNSLALDYPRDRLEIIVVSDASTDRTDAIVEAYAGKGVVLRRMLARRGKTAGLNEMAPLARGEILVFSDANALYAPDAIRKLVRNFTDSTAGCVTGDSRYVDLERSHVGKSEDTYWGYERLLKTWESRLGSMVGSDGAIFAIRKQLYSPLMAEDINDFVTPLQIVACGYRCIFEPEAVCYESATAHFDAEFRRKVRVVNRSWNGLFRVKQLLNPFRYGWFSVQLVSHKLLRWLTPWFLANLLVSSVVLYRTHALYAAAATGQVAFYVLGSVGFALARRRLRSRWLLFPSYFVAVNAASLLGVLKGLRGETIRTWQPERGRRAGVPAKRDEPVRGVWP